MKFFIIVKQTSQRLSGKNFLYLRNETLWERLINHLKGEEVYLNTDSKKILEACEHKDWVTTISRNQKHILMEETNISPVTSMTIDFLNEFADNTDVIATPHCTSPYINKDTIYEAANKLNEGYDSVEAVTRHQHFAYYNGQAVNFDLDVVQKTQDLEPIYLSNGAFFIFKKETFLERNNRRGHNPYLYPIAFPESIEIDTLEDFKLAKKFELEK